MFTSEAKPRLSHRINRRKAGTRRGYPVLKVAFARAPQHKSAVFQSTVVGPVVKTPISVTGSVGEAFSGGNCALCESISAWPAEVQLAIQEGIAEATALYQRLAPDVSPFSN
jgi:hypothetical protein